MRLPVIHPGEPCLAEGHTSVQVQGQPAGRSDGSLVCLRSAGSVDRGMLGRDDERVAILREISRNGLHPTGPIRSHKLKAPDIAVRRLRRRTASLSKRLSARRWYNDRGSDRTADGDARLWSIVRCSMETSATGARPLVAEMAERVYTRTAKCLPRNSQRSEGRGLSASCRQLLVVTSSVENWEDQPAEQRKRWATTIGFS